MIIEKILASVPQSKKDAVALSGGIHYDHDIGDKGRYSEFPLKTRSIHKCESGQKTFINLTGAKVGWLRVLGLFDDPLPHRRALWVVRCVCGHYEVRTSRALNNPGNQDDKCYKCRHLEYLRQRDADIQSGRYEAKIFKEVREKDSFSIGEKG